jgi:predicted lipid-binding transport protein (Tim44 family)
VELVVFGLIAVFLGLRLRGILGTRTGFEGAPPSAPVIAHPLMQAAPAAAPQGGHPLPDPASPLGRSLMAIGAADGRFDPVHFLAGAEAAFRMIVAAFTEGAREKLQPLLTAETYHAFDGAITAREAAGQHQHTEIKDITDVTIEDARLFGSVATITVRFVSRQVNFTTGPAGEVTAGTDAITEIIDIWSFERSIGSANLAWRLSAARSG